MKVNQDGRTSDVKAVWYDEPVIKMIDQRVLPEKFEIVDIRNTQELYEAIRGMTIRGAPSIGAAAAYGIAQARALGINELEAGVKLKSARPTANDLFFAVDFVLQHRESAKEYADRYVNSIVERSRLIGVNGNELIGRDKKILTHCNAGALASVDFGTALSPIRIANDSGKRPFVWVDETRPRLQGSRLTAWELVQEKIAHKVIADNAAGFLMSRGEVDLVIVGADRITGNGDFANKIGTYEKAVLAKENNIDFYVAAPLSTFDFKIEKGKDIPIEFRSEDEVKDVKGVPISPRESEGYNPAFDVTPSKYVKGYMTEYGIYKSSDLQSLKEKGEGAILEEI